MYRVYIRSFTILKGLLNVLWLKLQTQLKMGQSLKLCQMGKVTSPAVHQTHRKWHSGWQVIPQWGEEVEGREVGREGGSRRGKRRRTKRGAHQQVSNTTLTPPHLLTVSAPCRLRWGRLDDCDRRGFGLCCREDIPFRWLMLIKKSSQKGWHFRGLHVWQGIQD